MQRHIQAGSTTSGFVFTHVSKTPWRLEGEEAWISLITHFIGQRPQLEQVFMGARFDPSMDDGRNFLLQNIWYSQALRQFAWLDSGDPIASDKPRENFNGAYYYTDGLRVLLWFPDGDRLVPWVSSLPVDIDDVEFVNWQLPLE